MPKAKRPVLWRYTAMTASWRHPREPSDDTPIKVENGDDNQIAETNPLTEENLQLHQMSLVVEWSEWLEEECRLCWSIFKWQRGVRRAAKSHQQPTPEVLGMHDKEEDGVIEREHAPLRKFGDGKGGLGHGCGEQGMARAGEMGRTVGRWMIGDHDTRLGSRLQQAFSDRPGGLRKWYRPENEA